MKRICILLAIVFALSCIPAMAAEGDAILGMNEEERLAFSYCFSQGDTLYLAGFAELYTYESVMGASITIPLVYVLEYE